LTRIWSRGQRKAEEDKFDAWRNRSIRELSAKYMEEKPKKPTSAEVLSQAPRRDTYGPEHGSGNPHLQPGELQKVWHPAKPGKGKNA